MSLGEYSFLPWLRRGIANQLQVPAGATSRASIAVGMQVASNAAAPVDVPPRAVLLNGPGDVVGVNPQMVLRTEPRQGVTNFEPNYLAYVDFYDEDFPWRYTPDLPDVTKHRLPPWLTLLVLTDAEFQRVRRAGQPLPAIQLTPAADPSAILPPATQIWAWAHVHLNATLGPTAGPPNLDVLGAMLRTNPDVGYSRLLSPRHLQPNTRYHAFVIPTFEVGRQAGLGDAVAEGSSGLALSWATARLFPVYFEWWFATGAAGDFEDLVRALVPRDVDPRVGIRSMDVQQPGFLLPPTSGQPDDLVGLEGVLLAPTTKHVPVAATCDLPANLAAQVNLPADQQDSGAAAGEDPVISAPLYGRWHALVDRVQPFATQAGWVNELNTDPRFRAVAGMGTKVIQRNQEDYMKLAWQQIGDVLSMNRKIQSMQLAVKANEALLAKSFVALPAEQALAMSGPVMRKVMGSPVTVNALVKASRLPRAALSGAMRAHLRPRGMLMRRALGPAGVARPLAETVARLNDGRITAAGPPPAPDGATYGSTLAAAAPKVPGWLAWLARRARLAAVVIFGLVVAAVVVLAALGAALALVIPVAVVVLLIALYLYRRLSEVGRQLDTVDAFQPSAMTPAAFAALPPNDAFVLPVDGAPIPKTSPTGGPDSPQGAAFRAGAIEFVGGFADRPGAPALRDPLTIAQAWSKVAAALAPAKAFTTRFAATMRVGTSSLSQYLAGYFDNAAAGALVDARIVPVMAYPDIKLAMYAPLRDVLKDDFVPNLQLVPPNTLSLMLTNPPVIESYMVGLNHEFARELLWREYPTDQRPSTFRQFWDPAPFVDTENLSAVQLADKVRDIKKIHEWLPETSLGTHDNRPTVGNKPRVVLIIRGDLLKRYPNAIIYAQRARWGDPPRHTNHLVLYDQTGEKILSNPKDPAFSFPIFRAKVDPDITFIGFDLTLDDVRGDPTLDETEASRLRLDPMKLGWFFVLQEVVGEPRFGMDEHAVKTQGSDPLKWDYLSWENLGANVSVIDLKPLATEPPGSDDQGMKWGANAADMAVILFQRPALVAVHGREMLKNLALP
jgi:hypothetical protein